MLVHWGRIDGEAKVNTKADGNETARISCFVSTDLIPRISYWGASVSRTQDPGYNFGYEGFSRKLIRIARSSMRC